MNARAPRKGRSQASQQAHKRSAQLQSREEASAKQRAKRQAHPRRETVLDLLFGIPVTMGVLWLFLAYLHIV